MFTLTKLTLITGSLLTVFISQTALAQDNASNPNSKKGMVEVSAAGAPTTKCPTLGYCSFSDLRDYADGHGQAAYYYCMPPVGTTRFRMENRSVLITGFNSDGILEDDVSVLQKYSFGAYRDPDKSLLPRVWISDQDNNPIACYPGQGDRPVHPGVPRLLNRR
jgi:hypothetical protein